MARVVEIPTPYADRVATFQIGKNMTASTTTVCGIRGISGSTGYFIPTSVTLANQGSVGIEIEFWKNVSISTSSYFTVTNAVVAEAHASTATKSSENATVGFLLEQGESRTFLLSEIMPYSDPKFRAGDTLDIAVRTDSSTADVEVVINWAEFD